MRPTGCRLFAKADSVIAMGFVSPGGLCIVTP